MSKGGENSQISYAEKNSLILDLILWLFDFCHDSAKQASCTSLEKVEWILA
jgi:hypothetical protein